jgi:hypothetical protein
MKFITKILAIASILIASVLIISCEGDNKTEYKSFLIQVDSIAVPNSIAVNDSFDINFYGTVGTDGCFKFSHFKTDRSNNEILIECWGKVNTSAENCPTVMVFLDGEELSYTIDESGNYLLKIKQPDNSFLEKQITVE